MQKSFVLTGLSRSCRLGILDLIQLSRAQHGRFAQRFSVQLGHIQCA